MSGRWLGLVTRISSPITVPLARSGVIPLWGVVRHRGRRSGRAYTTPVAIGATRDSFVLPLPFGEQTDWCRNLRAAGGGVLHWRGADHTVVEPEIVDVSVAAPAFNAALRRLVRGSGIKKFLRVRRSVVSMDAGPRIGRTA